MNRSAQRVRYDEATSTLDTPLAIVDLDAFDANAASLEARAGGKPLRVPSKSVRCRTLIRRALARPGWGGIMAYSLSEALWLATEFPDVLVAYPTADRSALARLAGDEALAAAVTIMIDDVAQLDLVDATVPPERRAASASISTPRGAPPAVSTSASGARPFIRRPPRAAWPPRSRRDRASVSSALCRTRRRSRGWATPRRVGRSVVRSSGRCSRVRSPSFSRAAVR